MCQPSALCCARSAVPCCSVLCCAVFCQHGQSLPQVGQRHSPPAVQALTCFECPEVCIEAKAEPEALRVEAFWDVPAVCTCTACYAYPVMRCQAGWDSNSVSAVIVSAVYGTTTAPAPTPACFTMTTIARRSVRAAIGTPRACAVRAQTAHLAPQACRLQCPAAPGGRQSCGPAGARRLLDREEHTSELQSH